MDEQKKDIFSEIAEYNESINLENWKGSFKEYISLVQNNSKLSQLSHAKVLDMIESHGVRYDDNDKNKQFPIYNFFSNDLFGVEEPVRKLVKYLKAAASGSQVGRRILLLYGPTSSGKSQMATLLKNGLENWSKTEDGATYAIDGCPMHENPLNLIPHGLRKSFRENYDIKIDPLARLCPVCQHKLENEMSGDWLSMPVKRIFFSESNRMGIGTFLPGDQKCIAGDTIILTNNGFEQINEFGTKNEEIIDKKIYIESGQLVKSNMFFKYKDRGVKKISTDLGFKITATNNHPLMTVDNDGNFKWINVEDIKIGDTLVMSSGLGFNFNTDAMPKNNLGAKWTREFAKFIGIYIAEGLINANNRAVEISNQNPEIHSILRSAMSQIGLSVHLYPDNGKENARAMIFSKDLVNLMHELGLKTGAHNKTIPNSVIKCGFLKDVILGMWLGDGNVGKHKSKESNEATYSTVSEKLANQMHLLLLSLGIPAYKRFEENVGTSGAYTIRLFGHNVNKLVQILDIPNWKITRDLLCIKESRGSNKCLIPSIYSLVRNTYNQFKETHNWYRYGLDKDNINSRQFTDNSIAEFIKDAESNNVDKKYVDKLINLVDDKYLYVVVNNIESGIEDVYDIQVPEYHRFIANGFISHNSQSITELVGSADFSKLGEFGVESDPRAYKFDGELNVANRGIMEMIEMLKVDPKFLYVLLTLAQEKTIKTERFPLIYADEFIIAHTNETEYNRFLGDNKMEALHDRIIVVKFGYNLKLSEEEKIYTKLVSEADFGNVHIAPLTLKIASMFAILTRLETAKDANLTLLKKLHLYNGQDVEGFTQEDIKNIKSDTEREGLDGVSPRYIFNCVADCFSKYNLQCITPIDILRSIKENFDSSAKFSKEDMEKFDELLTIVVEEYTKMAKNEVQKAFFLNFEEEIRNLLNNYIDNVGAYLDSHGVEDEFGDRHEADEYLMRGIEEKVGISDAAKDSFRQEVYRKVVKRKSDDGEFDYKSHAKLREALEKQMFEERSDVIRLTVSSKNPDPDALKRLNQVIETLVDQYGYTADSANQLLRYVSSLMGRTT